MQFRRFLTPTSATIRTSVNLSETYRGHGLRVVLTRNGAARMTCVVYVDGKQVGFDVVLGNEAEALVEGVRTGVRTVDRWYVGGGAETAARTAKTTTTAAAAAAAAG